MNKPLHFIVVAGLGPALLAVGAQAGQAVLVGARHQDGQVAEGRERAVGEGEQREVSVDVGGHAELEVDGDGDEERQPAEDEELDHERLDAYALQDEFDEVEAALGRCQCCCSWSFLLSC